MSRLRRLPRVAVVAVILVLASTSPAVAHAELVDSDPDEGAVLAQAPAVITFTFSESVRGVPDGVEVLDATGDPIASSSRTRDKALLVTLDDEVGTGSLVVAWRVVSADGHPITGTLTFAVGAPSPDVDALDVGDRADDVPLALSLVRWPAYAGLLLAVGLVWFAVLLLPAETDLLGRGWRRLRLMARVGALVAAVSWLLALPLTARYLRGGGSLLDSRTWGALPGEELALTGVTVALVVGAAWLLGESPGLSSRHTLAALTALLALAPLPLSGHTRSATDADLLVILDLIHLAAGAVWLGGLVGLALTLPSVAGRHDVTALVVSRFSTAAAAVLAALVASGAVLAWRIVGSWSGLVDSGYGQLLLVKIGVASVAAGLAAYNRLRLLPLVRRDVDAVDATAAGHRLTRTASVEAVALVGVLLVTGFLVQKTPPSEGLAPAGSSLRTAQTSLGDLDAFVTLSPATTGKNTVTVRHVDGTGAPAEGAEPPRVRMTIGNLGGDVPLARTGRGTYEGRIAIPRDGQWEVQVSLRLGEFENPVASVELPVG